MDHWILKQLCAQVVRDIGEHIPGDSLPAFADPSWGYRAYQVGSVLTGLKTPQSAGVIMAPGWHLSVTARQTSAAEVLAHLGLLEGTRRALAAPPPDWNDREVTHFTKSLGQLEENVRAGVNQYLTHLPADEARPFLPLLGESGVPAANAETGEKPLSTTERNTLLRIIAALAVKGYGIDPKAARIDKLGEIRGDAEELGLSISDDTLRKKLRGAFAMIENGRIPPSGGSQELPGKPRQD